MDSILNLILLNLAVSEPLFYISVSCVLIVLLLLSATVSGSEIALFSLKKEDIEQAKDSKYFADRIAVRLIAQPQSLLAVILILNNLINVAIITISTYLVWHITGDPEGWLSIFIITVVVTLLLLFFGELLPKVFATQRNLLFIRRTVFFINIAHFILKYPASILVGMGNIIEKRSKNKNFKSNIPIEGLPEFIEEISSVENSSEKEKEILKGIVNFSSTTVKQIMTSRLAVAAFERSISFAELMKLVKENRFSRFPIYEDTIDNIIGILHVKDLIQYFGEVEDFEWVKHILCKDKTEEEVRPYSVPENKKIDTLLRDFQEKKVHIAIVVDEYGGTSGVVTLEDVLEEIVGEIDDEVEKRNSMLYTKIDERSYIFESKISLNDFIKIMNLDPTVFDTIKGESESLAGLMLELFSKFPDLNQHIDIEGLRFTIVSVSPRKIKLIKVDILG